MTEIILWMVICMLSLLFAYVVGTAMYFVVFFNADIKDAFITALKIIFT